MYREIIKFIALQFLLIGQCQASDCITYDFEESFLSDFTNDKIVCLNFPMWEYGFYNESSVGPPHPDSRTYISPHEQMSCAASFQFEIETTGAIEVDAIVESSNIQDQIVVIVLAINEGSTDQTIGQGMLVSTDGQLISTNGVHTISISWTVSGIYRGYVCIQCIKI